MAHQGNYYIYIFFFYRIFNSTQFPFSNVITSLCRSMSEEFKVPDGMVGFSKLTYEFRKTNPLLSALEDI